MDADNTDDLALLTDTCAQAESQLHSLEQAARGLNVNSNETGFMCFKQDGVISTLNSKPLKLIDEFIYLNSNISSTESNENIHIGNA